MKGKNVLMAATVKRVWEVFWDVINMLKKNANLAKYIKKNSELRSPLTVFRIQVS